MAREGGPEGGSSGTHLGWMGSKPWGTSGAWRTRTNFGVHLGNRDVSFPFGDLSRGQGPQALLWGPIWGAGDTGLALGDLFGEQET